MALKPTCEGHTSQRSGGRSDLGVTWKDLTIKVVPSDARLQENVLSQFKKVQQAGEARNKPPRKTILDGSSSLSAATTLRSLQMYGKIYPSLKQRMIGGLEKPNILLSIIRRRIL
jgi:hypothetical protein